MAPPEESANNLQDTTLDPWLSDLLSQLSFQTDMLQETAHQLVANAHAGIIFKEAAAQLETMRRTARTILQDVARWEDACVHCERPSLNQELTAAASDFKSYIEDFPNTGDITREDPRLRECLKPIFAVHEDATTLSELATYFLNRPRDPKSPEDITANLHLALAQIKVLSTLTFEEELEQLLQIVLPKIVAERTLKIIRERFGLQGNKKTLQELAQEFDISRERVRQLVRPFEDPFEQLIGSRPFVPALDKIIEFIVSWAPGAVDEFLEELQNKGLTSSLWNAKTLWYWAQQFGKDDQFSFVEIHQYPKGNILYVECLGQDNTINSDIGSSDRIINLARRHISRWGVASIEDIASKLHADEPSDFVISSIDNAEIERLLQTQFDFSWLDKDCNWFWFSKSERGGKSWNGLLTQIKKIFAVTNTIRISELRKGVARDTRRDGFAPPRVILLELCRQLPWLQVEDETIRLIDKSEVKDALSPTETILYHAFFNNDFILPRKDLEKICFAAGMRENTLHIRLGASPIVVRHATSVYGLRGHHVEPGKIDEVIARTRHENKGRSRALQDYGWKDNDIWISYKVSKSSLNGICSVPAGLKGFLNGEFQLQTFDDIPMGTLVCGENQAWGISPFMRRRGAEIGDYFLLVLNLQSRIAQIKLGDESLLGEPYKRVASESRHM
jgi:hypothetical protein